MSKTTKNTRKDKAPKEVPASEAYDYTEEALRKAGAVVVSERLQVKILGKTADDSARRIIAQTENGTDNVFFKVPAGQLDGIVTVLAAASLKAEGSADSLIISPLF